MALCGGLALYLLAHVGSRLRNIGTVGWRRIVAAAGCLALIPVATEARASARWRSCSACGSRCRLQVVRYAERARGSGPSDRSLNAA